MASPISAIADASSLLTLMPILKSYWRRSSNARYNALWVAPEFISYDQPGRKRLISKTSVWGFNIMLFHLQSLSQLQRSSVCGISTVVHCGWSACLLNEDSPRNLFVRGVSDENVKSDYTTVCDTYHKYLLWHTRINKHFTSFKGLLSFVYKHITHTISSNVLCIVLTLRY